MRRPLVIALMLAVAACNAESTAASIEDTTFASGLGVNLAASTKTASGLYYRDLTAGSGATAIAGHVIGVYYSGALPNGTIFDARGTPNPTFNFTLGVHAVIAGWDEGVVGMQVGGVRQLIVPPALGYGAAGQGSVPGNAIMVFTITMVSTN